MFNPAGVRSCKRGRPPLPRSIPTFRLEAALLRELQVTWSRVNQVHFRSAMRPPVLRLADASRRLAWWTPGDRTLSVSRALVQEHPWSAVVEVLRHEMAHQYVAEVLGVTDESAHGPAFRRVCRERGIDASAAGLPRGEGAAESKVLRRIRALLALSESPNENEARAAMAVAQRLILEHEVAWTEAHVERAYAFRQLGEPALRVGSHERVLAGILADHFFVRPIWVHAWIPHRARRGRVLEASGTEENLAIAQYVHGFVLDTAERLWRDYLREHPGEGRERAGFLLGVMVGFRETLGRQAEQARREGLVWVGDADLDAWFDLRYPSVRSSRRVRGSYSPAYADGRSAGRGIQVRHGLDQNPANARRLLK